MTNALKPVEGLGFDPEAIRRRYEEEAKMLAANRMPRQPLAASKFVSSEDPFVDPIERDALRDEVDVVVVGSGFTGLITGAHLRKAGVPLVRIIDKAGGFGGVWYWNRYPGIRCDVDASIYLPMLEDVDIRPSERYAHGDEIRAHCKALAEKFKLDEAACLQTQVTGVRWDESISRWIVSTDRGDEIRAQFVCLGSGTLNQPTIPAVPGLDVFQGHVFHSSRWDYDYTGGDAQGDLTKLADKRVAVVGTAASAIQFIPYLAQYAKHLDVIQRSPVILMERGNMKTGPEWYGKMKPGWQKERMENFTGTAQTPPWRTPPAVDLVDDSATRTMKRYRGGAPEVRAALDKANLSPPERALLLNYAALEEIRANIAAQVNDPVTAEAVKPYYNLGCKRPQFSDNYLPTYNLPNVSLIDTQGKGIERLTPTGYVAGGAEHEADCIIFATGFELTIGEKRAGVFPVIGRNGQALADAKGSLNGIMVEGFPNLFVVGDISQSIFTYNFTHLVAEQATYISSIITRCRAEGIASVEVRPEAQERWMNQFRKAAEGMPVLDLACPPDDIGTVLRAGYPRGALEYFDIIREWPQEGFDRDLIAERMDDMQPA